MCIFDNVWNYGKVLTNLYLYVAYIKLRVNRGVVNDPKKLEWLVWYKVVITFIKIAQITISQQTYVYNIVPENIKK